MLHPLLAGWSQLGDSNKQRPCAVRTDKPLKGGLHHLDSTCCVNIAHIHIPGREHVHCLSDCVRNVVQLQVQENAVPCRLDIADYVGTFAVEKLHSDFDERLFAVSPEVFQKVQSLFPAAEVAGYDNISCHNYYLTIPIMSFSESMPSESITEGSASIISRQANGLRRFSDPTCTADAPAIIISITSSADATPPLPITGILQAFATCQTIRRAIGNIAGPEKPPVLQAITGLRFLMSIRIPRKVLTSVRPSAPASSTAFAIETMSVTFGLSLMNRGFLVAALAAAVTSAAD